jgi:hypothetical protein
MRFILPVVVLAGAVVSGCGGGGSDSLSSGPIMTQTGIRNTVREPLGPLSPGQTYTAVYVEQTCRYQAYTNQPTQYRSLGCDPAHAPATLQVTVNPMVSGQPCSATATLTQPGTVVVTKTGPGDPVGGGAPPYYCTVQVIDPAAGVNGRDVLYV